MTRTKKPVHVGKALKAIRKRLKKNPEEMVAILNFPTIDAPALLAIEQGKQIPDRSLLERYAELIGSNVAVFDWLTNQEVIPNAPEGQQNYARNRAASLLAIFGTTS